MKLITILLLSTTSVFSQTVVYLQGGGPVATSVTGASTNGTTPLVVKLTTNSGLSVGDVMTFSGVCANNSGAYYVSTVNGLRKISAVNGDGTHVTITDTSGAALTSNGDWCDGSINGSPGGAQLASKMLPFNITSQPRGWFDGPTGTVTRQWALGTANGLDPTNGIVCNGATCTVTTTYNHGVQAGDKIALEGTTSTTLNTIHAGKTDYTVNASGLTSTTFTFNSTVASGNYTNNLHCGPGASPNEAILGTDNCVRVSQLAIQSSPYWVEIYGEATGTINGNMFYSIGDYPSGQLGRNDPYSVAQNNWAPVAMLFSVDQANSSALAAMMYILKNLDRLDGAGMTANEQDSEGGTEAIDVGSYVLMGVTPVYLFGSPYSTPGDKAFAVSSMISNITDPGACTKSTFHNKSISSGTAVANSNTGIQLASTASSTTNIYNNNVITGNNIVLNLNSVTVTGHFFPGDSLTGPGGATAKVFFYYIDSGSTPNVYITSVSGTFPTSGTLNDITSGASGTINGVVTTASPNIYGLVTAYNGATKVSTVGGGVGPIWQGTYVSGITATGAAGSTCTLTSFNGGGIGAAATLTLTGTNTIATATNLSITANGSGYGNVTSATVGNGTATCSGTPVLAMAVTSWTNYDGSAPVPPPANLAYNVYATITRSGTTITGYGTTFTKDVAIGDIVYGGNVWHAMNLPTRTGSYLSTYASGGSVIASDTSITAVVNGSIINANATPQIYWYANRHQGNTAYCGFYWLMDFWSGSPFSSPVTYPLTGGEQAGPSANSGNPTTLGGNNGTTFAHGRTDMDLVMADDDPRAIADLAKVSGYAMSFMIGINWAYTTGMTQSGSHYQYARQLQDDPSVAWSLMHSVPTYPNLGVAGPWITAPSLFKVFTPLPDNPNLAVTTGLPTKYFFLWGQGAVATDCVYPGGSCQGGQNYPVDGSAFFASNTDPSKYFQNYLAANPGNSGFATGKFSTADLPVKINTNRLTTSTYTAQPLQYLFGGNLSGITGTSFATCTSFFGTCPYSQNMRGDAVISRTGWSSITDGMLLLQARAFIGDHDTPMPGTLAYYRAGYLLGPDSDRLPASSNAGGAGSENWVPSQNDAEIQFGGVDTVISGLKNGSQGVANVVRWAADTHGSWDAAYGDANSNFMCVQMDLSHAYSTVYNAVSRWVCHFKKPSTEEIIAQYDYVDTTGHSQTIINHVLYPQNNESLSVRDNVWLMYDEGGTSCPGTGGCSSLNTNRQILEQQNGATSAGDPPRTNNLITNYMSPGPITVQWDGTSFPSSNSHANRVSICNGSNCSTNGTKLEDVIVHKITQQPDTTLTTTAINPDANWTGFQSADKVVLFARTAGTKSTVSGFTTTHAGTAQYVFAGLTAGTYMPELGGVPVASCNGTAPPCTVTDGYNTLYFESAAGAITLNGTPAGCALTGSTFFAAVVGTAYSSGPLGTASCSGGANPWSVSTGSLPAGLTLNTATGIISGTPTGPPGTANFTVQYTDGVNNPTQPTLITVAAVLAVSPSTWTTSCFAGGSNPGNQTISINTAGGALGTWTDTVTGSPWLTTSVGSGSGNGSVTAMISCGGLAAGTYTGTVVVNATGANNNPENSVVSVSVTTPPGSSLSAGSAVSAGTIRH